MVTFSKSITAKIVNAVSSKYLTIKLDEKITLVVQVKNKSKQVDDSQLQSKPQKFVLDK